jgi:hypothetical protein
MLKASPARADVQSCLEAAEAGQKLRDSGAYRRARELFITCAADECPGEVRKSCAGWLADLEKLTPTIVVAARARGIEVTDVRVSVDGEVVAARIDGKPIALDPGEHHFRFEHAGEAPVEQTSVVLTGEKDRLVGVRFGPEPPPAAPLVAPPPARAGGAFYTLGTFGLASLVAGAALDISGYVFLKQCAGDPSCTGQHQRTEVQWRWITGDVLLGAGALSGLAAWMLRPQGSPSASPPSAVHVGFVATHAGATMAVTMGF